MLHLDCPTIGIARTIDRSTVISSHRTGQGAVAYARCFCDGLVVLVADDRGVWQQTGHGAGPVRPTATTAAELAHTA